VVLSKDSETHSTRPKGAGMFRTAVYVVQFLLLLTSCQAKIDGSDDQSLKESIDKVRESLPEAERADFNKATKTIAYSSLKEKGQAVGLFTDPKLLIAEMGEKMDGMNAEQVIEEAKRLRAAVRGEEVAKLEKEIAELEAESEEAAGELSKLAISGLEYADKKATYTLTNNTVHSLSRVAEEFLLTTPGRAVPWAKKVFGESIPGGLEPGESMDMDFTASYMNVSVDLPEDAEIAVRVVAIYGPDGEAIVQEPGDYSKRRLGELRKELADMEAE
jgi:hypothetical protein